MLMDNLVYHYTSLEAMKQIVTKDICFWASRYDHLNDSHEQIWAKEYALNYCCDKGDEKARERIETFFAKYSYILCFCDWPDYRNMWRLYCNDGVGVCLGLDMTILDKISIKNSETDPKHTLDIFRSVYYASKKNIPQAIKYWEDDDVFNIMEEPEDNKMNMCAFIKDKDYDIEYECRYARIRENSKIQCSPYSNGNLLMTGIEDKKDVKYRIRGTKEVVPYLDIHFPHEALKKIIIGYKYHDILENVKFIIKSHLDEYGELYKKVEISESSLY